MNYSQITNLKVKKRINQCLKYREFSSSWIKLLPKKRLMLRFSIKKCRINKINKDKIKKLINNNNLNLIKIYLTIFTLLPIKIKKKLNKNFFYNNKKI